MKKGTFKITMVCGDNPSIDVNGYVSDIFGIHKGKEYWFIVHLPTGCRMTMVPQLKQAKGLVAALEASNPPIPLNDMTVDNAALNARYFLELIYDFNLAYTNNGRITSHK